MILGLGKPGESWSLSFGPSLAEEHVHRWHVCVFSLLIFFLGGRGEGCCCQEEEHGLIIGFLGFEMQSLGEGTNKLASICNPCASSLTSQKPY